MRTLRVVEREVICQLVARLGHALVGMQIDVLILDATPQPLDEHVGASSQLRRMVTLSVDLFG